MVLKKHTGITGALIGLLFPFLSSVSLASSGNNLFSLHPIDLSENLITLHKDQSSHSNISGKEEIDVITRLMKYRFLTGRDNSASQTYLKNIPHTEFLFPTPFSVPRPAYYSYLFMFKPFE